MQKRQRRTMLHLCVFGVLLLPLDTVSRCYAGDAVGTVKEISVRNDGLTWVELNAPHNNRPACAATQTYWMIKHESSAFGKQQYALLLAAKLASKRVSIEGANTCSRWFDGEDIKIVSLVD